MTAGSVTPVSKTVALVGGLDLVTPAVLIPPGRVIAAVNYEPTAKGYSRIDGIERLDGHTKPSEASYSYMTFGTGTEALTAGDAVTGATSGATGTVLIDQVASTGSFAGGDAAGFLVLTEVVGTWADGEGIQLSGVTKAIATSIANDRGAMRDDDDAAWLAAAALRARNAIHTLPGGGPVRGAWYFGGYVWGFRDDDADSPTKCRMYKATSAGWVLQDLGYSLSFTAGQAAGIAAGDTITGGTSAATGTVSRVLVTSGAFPTNDAAGRLILSAVTGTFQAESITVGGTTRATIAGVATANTIVHGGRFEFENHNFYGASSSMAMYAVYGTGAGFEWDGTVFTPFVTGASDERPIHLAAHRNRLFLAYRNGSLQGSQAGEPQGWSGLLGATAFGIGTDITGLQSQLAGTLAIFSLSAISILSGSSADDFALSPFTQDAGAIEWTVKTMGNPTYMDHGGVRNLTTSQAFGDFKVGTLTQMIQPLLDAKTKAGVTPVATLRVRTKAHYRVYFSDGTGISIYVGAKAPSILPFDLGARIPRTMTSGLDEDGNEILLMGCDDGYVYQIDKGTSLDGDTIDGFLRLPFNHCGSPNWNKRFHKMSLQVDVGAEASLFMTASFSDGDPDQPSAEELSFTIRGGGGFYNESLWNQFYWSSRVIGRAEAPIDGVGNNISPTIGTSSATENPHTISSLTLIYSMRGPLR